MARKVRIYAHPTRPRNRSYSGGSGNSYGFFPNPGTNYSKGSEPIIASRLDALAQFLKRRLTGISGYRTPAHSVAVGGFADDPHTKGAASDTGGVETVPESTLERFGLTRPFSGAREANHIQLLRSGGSSAQSGAPTQQSVVNQAAQKWHIPASILTGVWGMETAYGQNVATSSAGAVGDFQFIPGTAKSYKYPMTNNPNAQQFAQQADSAAHYLSDLYKQHGNWNDALTAYSGGGYGLKEVQNKAPRGRSFGGTTTTPRTRPGGTSSPTGTDDGPDVTTVLSDWATARDGETDGSDGNQFVSFGPGLIPTPLGLIPNPFNLSKGLSQSIHDTKDFFKLLAWIINPINILRMVEFLAGLVFMAFGFQAMLKAYNEGSGGLSSGGLARVSREVSRAATTAAAPEVTAATKAASAAKTAGAAKTAKSATKGTKRATPKKRPKNKSTGREPLNVS